MTSLILIIMNILGINETTKRIIVNFLLEVFVGLYILDADDDANLWE